MTSNFLQICLLFSQVVFVVGFGLCIPPEGSRLIRSRRMLLSASLFVPGEERKGRKSDKMISETDFWGRKLQDENSNSNGDGALVLPSVPSLDAHGELPLGAYTVQGEAANSPKETCRVSLALDSEKRRPDDELDFHGIVRSLQNYLDDGFQTFQVKSGPSQHHTVVEEEILGRFLAETPGFARDRATIVIPLHIPSVDTAPVLSPTFVRRNIAASLLRLGCDAIDCIQIQHRQNSPYFLDVLDTLKDMEREGLIRSISVRNVPPTLIRQAQANDFGIHGSQLDCNVLNPTSYTTEQKLMCSDFKMPLMAASPLVGGLLTDRYRKHIFEPLSHELSTAGNRHMKTTLRKWNDRSSSVPMSKLSVWQRFSQNALPTLANIALKHRVSIASVCLRWLLQLNHMSSTVVSYSLFEHNNEDEGKTARRIKDYRNVFRFELDEEDMAQLWELSGVEEPSDDFQFSFDDQDLEEYEMYEQASGLFLP